jgi:hypothetical protein
MGCVRPSIRTRDAEGRKRLGDWPIEIGLWVGGAASPNRVLTLNNSTARCQVLQGVFCDRQSFCGEPFVATYREAACADDSAAHAASRSVAIHLMLDSFISHSPSICHLNARFDRDLIRGEHYGQRSCEPHQKAEPMAAPTTCGREESSCQLAGRLK